MNEINFHFRSLVHLNDETTPLSVTINEIVKHAPHSREYFERLWLRQIVRNFYAKLELSKRRRATKTGLAPFTHTTLRELLDDLEQLRASHDRISGIRLKTSETYVLSDDDIEVVAA